MVLVWLSRVDAPEEVPPSVSFNVSWREWFLVWPFKKYRIISRIRSNYGTVDDSYILKHWWFWGYKNHAFIEDSGIMNDTEYVIVVGYSD